MADVYRRSGRGGAGNFYSQKEIDEATRPKSKDLEAQHPQPTDTPPTDPSDPPQSPSTLPPQTQPPSTTSTGRGGAGNFVDPAQARAAPSDTSALPHSAPHSLPSTTTTTTPRAAMSGRGGSGNWATGDTQVYDAEQERKRREALDAGILRDIRASLPRPPPKIHYMHGPGRGREGRGGKGGEQGEEV
ncbi:hypothetical protein F5B20DRAFT_441084 [Whalleya microplaca]|nr:hypothetical protein F5B20DRAFT_441084 [Whalleya microplaca]